MRSIVFGHLAICLVIALAACGSKKKPPQSPADASREPAPAPAGDAPDAERSINTPDDADNARDMKSADPEEGGE